MIAEAMHDIVLLPVQKISNLHLLILGDIVNKNWIWLCICACGIFMSTVAYKPWAMWKTLEE